MREWYSGFLINLKDDSIHETLLCRKNYSHCRFDDGLQYCFSFIYMYIAIIIQKELVMVYYNYVYIIAIPMHNNLYARN